MLTTSVSYTYPPFGSTGAASNASINPFRYTGREASDNTGLYYYRGRYYSPGQSRFVQEDPLGFVAGPNFYAYVTSNPLNEIDPLGLYDYSAQETAQQFLQPAYQAATSGQVSGLVNIRNNSVGQYDFSWNDHSVDTFNVNGNVLTASQFGNFIAGFQAGAYDANYYWTTGAFWAEAAVEAAGVWFHATGQTAAVNDPLDYTGWPDIKAGEQYGWQYQSSNYSQ